MMDRKRIGREQAIVRVEVDTYQEGPPGFLFSLSSPTPSLSMPLVRPFHLPLFFFFCPASLYVLLLNCVFCWVRASWQHVQKSVKSRAFSWLSLFFSLLSSILSFYIVLFLCALYNSSHFRLHPLHFLPFFRLSLAPTSFQTRNLAIVLCMQTKRKKHYLNHGCICILHFRTTTKEQD